MMTRSSPARSATGAQTVLEARLARMENKLDTLIALDEERRAGVRAAFSRAEKALAEHETRLRAADEALTALKTQSGMRQAGQAALTLLAAAVAAWLGASAR